MESFESPLVCEKVGEAMPDIAGIGILVGFSLQALITLVLALWVVFLAKMGRLEIQHEEGTKEHAIDAKRLELVSSTLMVGNDIQMLTGTALLITAFATSGTIDLYHLHLVYDTVSFVGVSNCAALVCWTFIAVKLPASKQGPGLKPRRFKWNFLSARHRMTYVFAICFLILTILLEIKLGQWSLTSDDLGYCFRTDGIQPANASHPGTNKTYVGVMSGWMLLALFGTAIGKAKWRKPLLLFSSLQFPVHMYMMISLRLANQNHLEGDESENGWDFGQTTATLLLALAFREVISKGNEYSRFEKRIRRDDDKDAAVEEGLTTITPTADLLFETQDPSQEPKRNSSVAANLEGNGDEKHSENTEVQPRSSAPVAYIST